MVKLKEPPLGRLIPGRNYFRFRLGPDISLSLGARVKRSGNAMVSRLVELSAVDRPAGDEVEPYERLLTDAMEGDQMLFVRQDMVEAAWAIVDPILGNVIPQHEYEPGSWGPEEAERLAADIGGWSNPKDQHPANHY